MGHNSPPMGPPNSGLSGPSSPSKVIRKAEGGDRGQYKVRQGHGWLNEIKSEN